VRLLFERYLLARFLKRRRRIPKKYLPSVFPPKISLGLQLLSFFVYFAENSSSPFGYADRRVSSSFSFFFKQKARKKTRLQKIFIKLFLSRHNKVKFSPIKQGSGFLLKPKVTFRRLKVRKNVKWSVTDLRIASFWFRQKYAKKYQVRSVRFVSKELRFRQVKKQSFWFFLTWLYFLRLKDIRAETAFS
jgi:hypothetical protein